MAVYWLCMSGSSGAQDSRGGPPANLRPGAYKALVTRVWQKLNRRARPSRASTPSRSTSQNSVYRMLSGDARIRQLSRHRRTNISGSQPKARASPSRPESATSGLGLTARYGCGGTSSTNRCEGYAEPLPDGRRLQFCGVGTGVVDGSTISLTLNGEVLINGQRVCHALHQFTFTRSPD